MSSAVTFIAIITGLIQVIKMGFKLEDNRYVPLFSVVMGIGLAFLGQNGFDMTVKETVLFGLMLGLSAAGLFSGLKSAIYVTKQVIGKIKKV